MRKEKFWYGFFMSTVMVVGMVGTAIGDGSLKATASETEPIEESAVISRSSWTNKAYVYSTTEWTSIGVSKSVEHYDDYIYTKKIYSNGVIELKGQISSPLYTSKNYSIGTIEFNDSLYEIDFQSKYNLKYVESYDNENKIVEVVKDSGYYFNAGEIFTITLTPLGEPVQNVITAFSEDIQIEGSQMKENSIGDIDGNGLVNATDAALILTYAAEYGSGSFNGTIEDWYNEKNNGE